MTYHDPRWYYAFKLGNFVIRLFKLEDKISFISLEFPTAVILRVLFKFRSQVTNVMVFGGLREQLLAILIVLSTLVVRRKRRSI